MNFLIFSITDGKIEDPSNTEQRIETNHKVISSYDDLLNFLREIRGQKTAADYDAILNELTKGLVGWPGFQDVFTVSALYGDGIEDLRDYLLEKSKPSPGVWKYNQDLSTDKDPRELVINVLKSKFLDVLSFDVPYTIEPAIETWSVENGTLKLLLSVTSNKSRTTNLLLSNKASNLHKVAKLAERDLQNLFQCEVFVVITVNVTHAPKQPLFQQPVTTELGIDRHLHLH